MMETPQNNNSDDCVTDSLGKLAGENGVALSSFRKNMEDEWKSFKSTNSSRSSFSIKSKRSFISMKDGHRKSGRKKTQKHVERLKNQIRFEEAVAKHERERIVGEALHVSEAERSKVKSYLPVNDLHHRLNERLSNVNHKLIHASEAKRFFGNVKPKKLGEIEVYLNNQLAEIGMGNDTKTMLARLEIASSCWQALIETLPSVATVLCDIKEHFDRKAVQHVVELEQACIENAKNLLQFTFEHEDGEEERGETVAGPSIIEERRSNNILPPESRSKQHITLAEKKDTEGILICGSPQDRKRGEVEAYCKNRHIPLPPQRPPSNLAAAQVISPRKRKKMEDEDRKEFMAHIQNHVMENTRTSTLTRAKDGLPPRLMTWLDECMEEIRGMKMNGFVFQEVYSILTVCMHEMIINVSFSNRNMGQAILHLWTLLLQLFETISNLRKNSLDRNAKEELRFQMKQKTLADILSSTSETFEKLTNQRKKDILEETAALQKSIRTCQSSFDVRKMKVLLLQGNLQQLRQREVSLRRKGIALMNRRLVKKIVRLAAENEEIQTKEDTSQAEKSAIQNKLEEELEKHKNLQKQMAIVFGNMDGPGKVGFGQSIRNSNLDTTMIANIQQLKRASVKIDSGPRLMDQAAAAEELRQFRQAMVLSPKALEEQVSHQLKQTKEKESVKERQRLEAQRKEDAKRREVYTKVRNRLDLCLHRFQKLEEQVLEPSHVKYRDACFQVNESDFEVKPISAPLKRWQFKSQQWEIRKNTAGMSINPHIPHEFLEELKMIPVAYKPTVLAIGTTRKLIEKIYGEHYKVAYRSMLQKQIDSYLALVEASRQRRVSKVLERRHSSGLLDLSENLDLSNIEALELHPFLVEFFRGNMDLQHAKPGSRPTSKQKRAGKLAGEKRLLDFLESVKTFAPECTWIDTFRGFIQNQAISTKRNLVAGEEFDAEELGFVESALCCLSGRIKSHRSLVEAHESGKSYVTPEAFVTASDLLLSQFTAEDHAHLIDTLATYYTRELRLNDREYTIGSQVSKSSTTFIPLQVAIETLLAEHRQTKIRLIQKLEALFEATDVQQDGILGPTQFSFVVRSTNPDLSKRETGRIYRAALQFGENSQTVQRADFVTAAYYGRVLHPVAWEAAEIGISQMALEDGIDFFDDVPDVPKQLAMLAKLWKHHQPFCVEKLDELAQSAVGIEDQREVTIHRQRMMHAQKLIEKAVRTEKGGESTIRAAWVAFWLHRFSLAKTNRTKEVVNKLGSIQMLMRWKLRMRALTEQGKSRRAVLHPVFSRCRWHRTGPFLEYLDGSDTEKPFPINEVDDCGNSLLHIAVQNGHDDFVSVLLDRGVDVDLQNMTGQTAMHFAKFYEHKRIFFMLRRAGGNDKLLNKAGLTCHEVEEFGLSGELKHQS